MSLFCIGINHQSAPVELRERLAYSERELPEALQVIRERGALNECVLLSTCNRVEVYAAGDASLRDHSCSELRKLFSEKSGLSSESVIPFYEKFEKEALAHLCEVAGGLDSMVLGETEIFGQLKNAYSIAHGEGSTGKLLNSIFQRVFSIGKKLRSHTNIQVGSTSVGSVSVDLAEKIFGPLENCSVMLLGAGEMSRQTAQALSSRGAGTIVVSNRSYDRAVEMANAMQGEALHFDEWDKRVSETDILICSTSAPHYLITPENLSVALKKRRRPLFLIDIAVPRNVDPAVSTMDSVYLYDIDHLQNVANKARDKRLEQVSLCRDLIQDEIKGISLYFEPAKKSLEGK